MKSQVALGTIITMCIGCGPSAGPRESEDTVAAALTLTGGSGSNDEATLDLRMNYSAEGTYFRAYLDSDLAASTGFAVGGIGAEYLLENAHLWLHTGTGWSWRQVATVSFTHSGGLAHWSLSRALIGQTAACGDRVKVRFNIDNSALLPLDYTYACAGAPPAQPPPSTPPPSTPPPSSSPPPPKTTISYSASGAKLLNPERGFYNGIDILSSSSFSNVRGGGFTLALAQVRLDAYRDTALPSSLLSAISAGLARVRAAGFKAILRFKYNDGPDADASRAQILAHITQLTPIFQDNADVIAVVQAGFIGAWGEWHSSTHGLDNPTDRTAILNALLAAVPTSRMVQVRTPMFIDQIFPGGPLAAAHAFDGSNQARTGHHNDCFLASDSDYGTYASPIATWKAYIAQIGLFTAIGGETCSPNPPRSVCPGAPAEMRQLHYSYINSEYNPSVLSSWTNGGCMDAIVNELGYRFRPVSLNYNDTVKPGGVIDFMLTVANDGYAALYNPRPVKLVLSSGSQRWIATLAGRDARSWASGTTTTLSASLTVPSAAAAGRYTLSLWLPDASPSIESRPEYAVQLAASGMSADSSGANPLGSVTIDPSASGPSVPDASAFTER